MPASAAATDLQRLVRLFQESLQALGAAPTDVQLETWGILVHTSMSGGEREYHGVQHVFDVADKAGPVETLAALFHDAVYVQTDGYVSQLHRPLFDEVVTREGGQFRLRSAVRPPDRLRAMVEATFGLQPGSALPPWGGLSEFLSALLAVRSLQAALRPDRLTEVAAAIEATIPFRPDDQQGQSAMERLWQRLQIVDREFGLGWQAADPERVVHQAVAVANRDVAGFALADTGRFLDSTWDLLPESVLALRRKASYTLGEYRFGLLKMAGFFGNLAPQRVFCQFRGVPDEATLAELSGRAAANIARAHRYLQAKLAASSVLYALAVLTGGDAPAALFMGDLPGPGRQTMRLEDFLSATDGMAAAGDQQVFALLYQGRQTDSGFDIRNSPLAAYLYARLGEAGITRLVDHAPQTMDATAARQLLDALPYELLREIAIACSRLAITRAHRLRELLAGMQPGHRG
jgi:hypothetical protein